MLGGIKKASEINSDWDGNYRKDIFTPNVIKRNSNILANMILEDPSHGAGKVDIDKIKQDMNFVGTFPDGPSDISMMFSLPEEYYGEHTPSLLLNDKGEPVGGMTL